MSRVCGFYCFETMDLLFIFEDDGERGVTKLVTVCGSHKGMTPNNAKLCYMNTDRFIIHITTEDIYEDFADLIHQIMTLINHCQKE